MSLLFSIDYYYLLDTFTQKLHLKLQSTIKLNLHNFTHKHFYYVHTRPNKKKKKKKKKKTT